MKMFKTALRWLGVVAFLWLGAPAFGDPPWQPTPAPATLSGAVHVLLLCVDGSGSMLSERSRSVRVQSAAAYAINQVSPGTYVIVAIFGTQAHVVTGRFVLTAYDKTMLRQAVEGIAMRQGKTDIAALEALVGQVRAALTMAFGSRGFRLDLQVLTDGRPDPVDPSDKRTFDVLLGQSMTKSPLGGGLFAYTTTFLQRPEPEPGPVAQQDGDAAPGQRQTSHTAPEAAPAPSPSPAPAEMAGAGDPGSLDAVRAADTEGRRMGAASVPDPAASRTVSLPAGASHEGSGASRPPWPFVLGGAGILGLLLLAGLIMRARAQREGQTILEQTTAVPRGHEGAPQQIPVALLVTEWMRASDGERRLLQGPKALAYTPGVPLTLGADPRRCAWVLQTPEAPARLAALELDGRGHGTVTPLTAGLQLDGQAVEGPIRLLGDDPHVITAGALELHLEPLHQLPEAEDRFFRRLQESAQITNQPHAQGAETRAVA